MLFRSVRTAILIVKPILLIDFHYVSAVPAVIAKKIEDGKKQIFAWTVCAIASEILGLMRNQSYAIAVFARNAKPIEKRINIFVMNDNVKIAKKILGLIEFHDYVICVPV